MRRKRRYLSTRRVGYLKTGPKLDANQLYQLLPTYFRTHLIIPRANGTGMTSLCLFFFSFKDQEHTFNWEDLTNWEADDEAMAFCFEYSKGGKKPRWVKIYSQYVRRYVELSAWLVLERERERTRGFPSTKKAERARSAK